MRRGAFRRQSWDRDRNRDTIKGESQIGTASASDGVA
jgi:hypothetical protein